MDQENNQEQNENMIQNEGMETQQVQDENEIGNEASISDERWFLRTRNIVYYILGVIEVLLLFRLIFRSLAANTANPIVAALYSTTKALISPFVGIFNVILPGGTTQYVIEPATIIAMVVYALIAYGIIKLIKVTAVSV